MWFGIKGQLIMCDINRQGFPVKTNLGGSGGYWIKYIDHFKSEKIFKLNI